MVKGLSYLKMLKGISAKTMKKKKKKKKFKECTFIKKITLFKTNIKVVGKTVRISEVCH